MNFWHLWASVQAHEVDNADNAFRMNKPNLRAVNSLAQVHIVVEIQLQQRSLYIPD